MIKVLVNGAFGKMGQASCASIKAHPKLSLVGECGHQDDLTAAIKASQAQVVVDFTNADAGFENVKTIIKANVHPVIGTSGFSQEKVEMLKALCDQKKLGGIVVPNFAIGAVLMMQFSQKAAQFYDHVEIIEMHHEKKLDAPSGTAVRTAEMIAQGNATLTAKEIPTHSVRLPGLVAHQQVIFGAPGETLTIKDDCIDRQAFMPGVCLACEKVGGLTTLQYGLETIL